MSTGENKDFFSRIWKCPFRRSWRYGRKVLFVFIWGIVMWIGLDCLAIVLMKPQNDLPFLSLLVHALLTISLSLILTVFTHQLFVRLNSRFKPIRAFQPLRRSSDGR